jgi:hypothetical protein
MSSARSKLRGSNHAFDVFLGWREGGKKGHHLERLRRIGTRVDADAGRCRGNLKRAEGRPDKAFDDISENKLPRNGTASAKLF